MSKRQKQVFIEGAFIASLLILCAILTALQFHWTGQLSQAETDKLNSTLDDQVRMVTDAFDDQLAASCSQLLPRDAAGQFPPPGGGPPPDRAQGQPPDAGDEPIKNGIPSLEEPWATAELPPRFRRVAVAVPQGERLALFPLPFGNSLPKESPWPDDWAKLHRDLLGKVTGESPGVYRDDSGLIFEFPILTPGGPARERGWVIFQIDEAYLRTTWLPGLIRQFLGKTTVEQMSFEVIADNPSKQLIFSQTGNAIGPRGRAFMSVGFNHYGRADNSPPGFRKATAWKLTVSRNPDALDAAVRAARLRNLGVALAVNTLILAAGIALVRYTRRSRQLAEAQMTFVATVSHELRTPLTVIRGAAQNLERGVVQDPIRVQAYAKLIDSHADQLSEMVEQILHKTGVRSNHAAFESANVALLLEEAIAATAPEVSAGQCRVKFFRPQDDIVVHADPSALRRAFQNLIINAVKHGGAGQQIDIQARSTNGSGKPLAEVTVSDEGPGIPEADLDQIFEPFYRGERARSQQVRGSGLGLNVVKETVATHGGRISASNSSSGGAKFTILLPRSLSK